MYKSVQPNIWVLKRFQEISKPTNGIVDGPFGSDLKVSDYIDDTEQGIPVLTTKNLTGDYSPKSVRYISQDKFEQLKRSAVFPGDILVAKIGSIGKCCIYPLGSKTAMIPANLLKITLLESMNSKFVYYYISSFGFQRILKSISTATAQPAFNVTKFRNLTIPTPPLPEQERIVARIEELFSDLDKGVEALQTIKGQLKVYRQAVIDSYLIKSASDTNIVVKTTLGDLCESVRNGYSKRPDDSGLHHILRISSVRPYKVNLSDYRLLEAKPSESNCIKNGDLLFTRYNGSLEYVGVCGLVKGVSGLIAYPDKLIRCRIRDPKQFIPEYLQYALNSSLSRKFIRSKIKTTAGQKGISSGDIQNVPLEVPIAYIQLAAITEIESRLSVCDKIEQTVEESLAKAESLRQSILKKAFEGRL